MWGGRSDRFRSDYKRSAGWGERLCEIFPGKCGRSRYTAELTANTGRSSAIGSALLSIRRRCRWLLLCVSLLLRRRRHRCGSKRSANSTVRRAVFTPNIPPRGTRPRPKQQKSSIYEQPVELGSMAFSASVIRTSLYIGPTPARLALCVAPSCVHYERLVCEEIYIYPPPFLEQFGGT